MRQSFAALFAPLGARPLRRTASGRWLWAAGGGAMALVAAAILVWRTPVQIGEQHPDAGLQVTSVPAGASIEVDGRSYGRTPATIRVPAGERRVTLRLDAHADATYRVHASRNETAILDAELWLQTPRIQRLRPTFPGATIADARFLADGRVTFLLALPGDERQLWLLDAGNLPHRLGPPDGRGALAASPDGQRVAYLARSGRADGRLDELWLTAPDGDSAERRDQLPSTVERLTDLSWAPDGQRLLLVGREQRTDGAVHTQLRVVDAQVGEPRLMFSFPGEVVPSSYTWRPDGVQVAFLTRSDRLIALCLLDVRTGEFRYLADLSRDDSPPLPVAPVAWSPDGLRLTYAAPAQDPSVPSIWPFGPKPPPALFTVDANRAVGQRLGSATGQSPAWRRDGNIVALARPNGSGPLVLRSVDVQGESRDTSSLPLNAANTLAARWDLAHAQAIVVVRSTNGFGGSQTDYWLVRFREEVAP
jgi:dipeptidyl aminopeptidase/acylaminoacyl peptidase